MAARKMVGKDNVLLIDPTGGVTYQTVLCLTENSFKIAVEIIDAKTKCGADNLPGATTFEISCAGQLMVDGGLTELDTAELYNLVAASTTIGWKMGKATPISKDVSWAGTGFIANLDMQFPQSGPATFTCTLGVYGTPTMTVTT